MYLYIVELLDYLIYFEAFSFLFFGFSCLATEYMRLEFIRYGLAKQREFTGIVQLLCSLGLFVGAIANINWLVFLAASGLFFVMLAGFIVRLKIRDGFGKSFPALFYTLLSLYIAYNFYDYL
nr:DoxX family protein [Winogradskyella sp.]